METGKTTIDGSKVTIDAGSVADARALAAAAEDDLIKKNRTWAQWFDSNLDSLGDIIDVVGRPAFNWLAWALAVIGSVIAFISWSRILPVKEIDWLLGLVGVVIVLFTKLAAARWASSVNFNDKQQVKFWSQLACAGLVINFVAAFAFQAAVSDDQVTGVQETREQVALLQREARELKYEADEMNAPVDPLDVLEFDLNRALNRAARNNQGQVTDLSVATVVAWGTDDYCMPGGRYASYVERYCEEVAALHRDVIIRTEYDSKISQAAVKSAEAKVKAENMPRTSSATALGKAFSSGWRVNLFGAFLMLIIEGAMVASAYTAKRHPKIAYTSTEGE